MERIYKDFDSLQYWTKEELHKRAQANRDLLIKRRKRLEAAVEKAPELYSTYGLKSLQKEIPKVSTSMDKQTLKSVLVYTEKLKSMKTGTARGAKKHQTEMIRRMVDLPVTGRLNAEQSRVMKIARAYVENDPDIMNKMWDAFKYYQTQVQYKNYDSQQELKDFLVLYNSDGNMTKSLDDLRDAIKDLVDAEYQEEQKRKAAKLLGRGTMWNA